MLVNSKQILWEASQHKYAVPSPDFVNQNTIRCYIEVAEEVNKPIIVAYSEAHKNILTMDEAILLGKYYADKAKIPVCLHIDHGKTIDFVKQAIDKGFTSVMIDASLDNFDDNVKKTKEIVDYAKKKNVTVEAEIGHVGAGINYEKENINDSIYSTVDDCMKFVELTSVDSLAISIGTAHGIYKNGIPKINFDRLVEIKKAIKVPLVLHGGSSTGDENLKKCAELGIAKINLYTDIVAGGFKAMRESNARNLTDLYKDGDEGLKNVLRHYYNLFCK